MARDAHDLRAGGGELLGEGATEAAARARIEAWLAPISDANPAGEDARYDELHQQIRDEAAKIDSPSAGTTFSC